MSIDIQRSKVHYLSILLNISVRPDLLKSEIQSKLQQHRGNRKHVTCENTECKRVADWLNFAWPYIRVVNWLRVELFEPRTTRPMFSLIFVYDH